jgi:pyruvate kinase
MFSNYIKIAIRNLIKNGMNVTRLNFSHGTHLKRSKVRPGRHCKPDWFTPRELVVITAGKLEYVEGCTNMIQVKQL